MRPPLRRCGHGSYPQPYSNHPCSNKATVHIPHHPRLWNRPGIGCSVGWRAADGKSTEDIVSFRRQEVEATDKGCFIIRNKASFLPWYSLVAEYATSNILMAEKDVAEDTKVPLPDVENAPISPTSRLSNTFSNPPSPSRASISTDGRGQYLQGARLNFTTAG